MSFTFQPASLTAGAVAGALFLLVPPQLASAASEEMKTYVRMQERLQAAENNPVELAKLRAQMTEAKAEIAEEQRVADIPLSTAPGFLKDVSGPRVRRSFADLLTSETGYSTLVAKQGEILKDLEGAEIAFTDDFEADEESWNAQAALLWPLVWKTGFKPEGDNFGASLLGLMPSVTLNRFDTNRMPKDEDELEEIKELEKNELTYRLGAFATFSIPGNLELVTRAAGGFRTDTDHEREEFVFETEMEPLWQMPGVPWFGVGYFAVPHALRWRTFDPNNPKTWRDTYLAYQARLRLRYVYGTVYDDGTGEEGPTYSRGGLSAAINFDPFLWQRLTASFSWTYLDTIHGKIANEHYIEARLGLLIWEDPDRNQRVSLDASYAKGAQDYLGAKAEDIFKVTLGVVF